MEIIIFLTLIILLILLFGCFSIYMVNKNSYKRNNMKETLDNLNRIIEFKCKNYAEKVYIPLQKKSLKDMDLTIKTDSLNKAVAIISTEIITSLSKEFKKELYCIINEKSLDVFITEQVYEIMSSITLQMNSKAINTMNSISTYNYDLSNK